MQEQHELIRILKDLAVELGRPPRAYDLTGVHGISQTRLNRVFGSFSLAMQAAGIPLAREAKQRKVSSELFEKPLEPHLEKQHERQLGASPSNFILPAENYPTTVVLGDFHAPFHHVGAMLWAIEVIRELRPKRVVQIGDLRDMFSWGKYPRSQNIFTPQEEIEAGTKACTELWARIREAAPDAECFQLFGNHDIRPYKRVLESCPELEMFIDLKPLYTFEGVTLIDDDRQELELDGVFYHHGYKTKLGDNRDFMNACFVGGHSHRAGVSYRAIYGGHMLWELNAGTLGDPQSKGLSYTPQRHHLQTLGLGVIDRFGPRFAHYRPRLK